MLNVFLNFTLEKLKYLNNNQLTTFVVFINYHFMILALFNKNVSVSNGDVPLSVGF